ncbi:MAG: hypothetical protein QW452_02415 [Pyrobaculum sp.]
MDIDEKPYPKAPMGTEATAKTQTRSAILGHAIGDWVEVDFKGGVIHENYSTHRYFSVS